MEPTSGLERILGIRYGGGRNNPQARQASAVPTREPSNAIEASRSLPNRPDRRQSSVHPGLPCAGGALLSSVGEFVMNNYRRLFWLPVRPADFGAVLAQEALRFVGAQPPRNLREID